MTKSIKINDKSLILSNVGSSETIRKTPLYKDKVALRPLFTQPFDWSNVNLPQHLPKNNYSQDFLSWFVGFSEGDGSFIIDEKNNRLFFTITQKDAALLKRLRTQLGFGIICNDNTYPEIKRFTVSDRSHIKNLIHIFNGNLLLNKTTQRFVRWVNYYNLMTNENIRVILRWNLETQKCLNILNFSKSREKCSLKQIQQLRSESVVWNSSWLTGFFEAEGCFYAVQRFKTKKATKKTIEMRFILDQTNELKLLSHVRELLGDIGCIWIHKKVNDKIHYRYEVSNWDALLLIVKYLETHKLRSNKKIVYVRWKKLINFLELIKKENQIGLGISSEKRQQKINRLVLETKQEFLNQTRLKEIKLKVEDRVPL